MVVIWTALYVLAILLANLTLNHFITLPGGYGLLSIGTLFFGAVFTLRDRLHMFGLKAVYLAIALALLVNATAGWFLMADEPHRLRFLFASFSAILISELTDTVIYHNMMQRSWLTRALSSNAISIPLDTILFTLLAFYGIMSTAEMVQIVYADLIFKAIVATLVALAVHFGLKKRSGAAKLAV